MPDLIVKRGETRSSATDLVVTGWIDVHGTLDCAGDLTCLGISVEPGGTVRCHRLVANVVDVDNIGRDVEVEATAIHARLVMLVQVVGSLGVCQQLGELVDLAPVGRWLGPGQRQLQRRGSR